ncbi:pyridoxal-phosphate dependent enzyme [Corynebacterium sp.]|uniref:pyridoxal-phosphate dependent enzyme n=1 Tax=Corynebacterium sp. TaxID=1720 RepID=UPI003462E22E
MTTGIRGTVGGTPLVLLDRLFPGPARVWAKLEGFNPSGSAKDRTAAALLASALSTGTVRAGACVVESSSGNLGVALARDCALHDIDFHCVVDPHANRQTVAVMTALGATVHHVDSPDPATGDWLAARRTRVADLLRELPGAVNLDQYSNRAAFDAHSSGTMREIVDQLGRAPDALFVAVSTTGTIGGCVRHLRETGARTRVTAVDAEGSVLYGGRRGERLLPGFGAGVVPDLAGLTDIGDVVRVSAADTVAGARALARREGILPGASGGAVVAAAAGRAREHGRSQDAEQRTDTVLVLHDFGTAYLDTLYDDDWVAEHIGVVPSWR